MAEILHHEENDDSTIRDVPGALLEPTTQPEDGAVADEAYDDPASDAVHQRIIGEVVESELASKVRTFIIKGGFDEIQAEDVVQAVLTSLVGRGPKFIAAITDLEAFAFVSARNKVRDLVRPQSVRQRNVPKLAAELVLIAESAEDEALNNFRARAVQS